MEEVSVRCSALPTRTFTERLRDVPEPAPIDGRGNLDYAPEMVKLASMQQLEIETEAELREFLGRDDRDWSDVVLRGLDLQAPALDERLARETLHSSTTLLGCRTGLAFGALVIASRALVIPPRDGLPYDPFRSELYSHADLLAGFDRYDAETTYRRTPDWLAYEAAMDERAMRKRTDLRVEDVMYMRLHDLAVAGAMEEFLTAAGGPPRPKAQAGSPQPDHAPATKRVVGIMGGYDRPRAEKVTAPDGAPTAQDAPYMQVALLAHELAGRGYTVATGGGPGAMEAANLGAWFAARPEAELREAVRVLARVPKIPKTTIDGADRWLSGDWLAPAFAVIERYPRNAEDPRTESIGIPTWFYGHEPPNPFATHIAKYFENSLREEGLLAIANCGVVFAEGNAGTVQEIFQDGCQNYYGTYGPAVPMILLGTEYWNPPAQPDGAAEPAPGSRAKPVWPLLQQLAREKHFTDLIKLEDDRTVVVERIVTAEQDRLRG